MPMSEDYKRAIVAILLAFFAVSWFTANRNFEVGIYYSMLLIGAVMAYALANVLDLPIAGIKKNWINNVMFGAGLGMVFVFGNLMFPQVVIGYPQQALLGDQFITTGLIAPFAEEFAFRGLLLSLIDKFTPFGVAVVVSSMAFSLFHWAAYGTAMSSAFVGAFMFGVVAAVVTKHRNSIVPAIMMHSVFNIFLYMQNVIFLG